MTDMERLAQWMLANSIPTGHGDDMDGLLEELTLWVEETRRERDRYRAALKEGEALDMLTDPSVSHTALLAVVNRFIRMAREALDGE